MRDFSQSLVESSDDDVSCHWFRRRLKTRSTAAPLHKEVVELVIPVSWRRITLFESVRATRDEKRRALPGDELISQAIDTLTHAVTIRRAPHDVWPWLVQMGAGSRAGWYSYDRLDNGRQPSAMRIVPELQHPVIGSIFPALPGVTDGFTLLAIDPERMLTALRRARRRSTRPVGNAPP